MTHGRSFKSYKDVGPSEFKPLGDVWSAKKCVSIPHGGGKKKYVCFVTEIMSLAATRYGISKVFVTQGRSRNLGYMGMISHRWRLKIRAKTKEIEGRISSWCLVLSYGRTFLG